MPSPLDPLFQQLGTLKDRFAALAARLAEDARGLQAAGTPPSSLPDEVGAARGEFARLVVSVCQVVQPPGAVASGLRSLQEVEALLRTAYDAARRIMHERRDALDALAAALKANETLDGDAIRALVREHGPLLKVVAA